LHVSREKVRLRDLTASIPGFAGFASGGFLETNTLAMSFERRVYLNRSMPHVRYCVFVWVHNFVASLFKGGLYGSMLLQKIKCWTGLVSV
jgi:hypothetical protein